MPLKRILVIGSGLPGPEAAAEMLLAALAAAGSPQGLRFALPKRMERAFCLLAQQRPQLPQPLFYGERGGLASVAALLTDETHFLSLTGLWGFESKWDQTLLNRLARTPERNAVLTGCVGEAGGEIPVQAYLPALAENFEEGGVLIQRGLPLVCSAAPVRTLVIDPALLFGPVGFLRGMDLRRETLSFAAYVAGVPVYALDRAALWPLAALPPRRLCRPVEDALPGTTLARFEQLAGFRYEQKRAGVRTTWGLFTTGDGYAQQLPVKLALAQHTKALFARSRPGSMPLMVTAFIDLPDPRKPIPVYLLRFEYLKALVNLPLYLYAGGAQERLLRASFANARSYPDNSLLPKGYLQAGMTTGQWLRRNKLLLLEKAAREHPDLTHVAWVNIDMLKHPVCPQATPDFSAMMDDRVHLATVNAIPDASFLLVPVRHLRLLRRELTAITQLDVELKRSLTEVALIQRLYARYPDLFALHPMPKKHLLFLEGFDPALLDQRYQALLSGLPPVVRAEPPIGKERETQ